MKRVGLGGWQSRPGCFGHPMFKISIRGATLDHEFLVCKGVNDDIMSIGLANQLEISYNANTQKLCTIAPVHNSLVLHQQTLILAQSAAVITTKFNGTWHPEATYVATLHNPCTGFVVGGPALVSINDQLFCDVAVFSAAPFDIRQVRGDFMEAIDEVPSTTTEIGSIKTIPVAAIQPRNNHLPVQPEELRSSILEYTPVDRQEELLQLLLQFPAQSSSRLAQDSRPINNREPFYQKQGKITHAHRPVIEETLDSWLPHRPRRSSPQ